MTLVFDAIQPNMPQAHLLVVGVGRYPHLLDGDQFDARVRHLDLGQLTSPPVSARHFAKWWCENYNNPQVPLGSVELFLSEVNPTPFEYTHPQNGAQSFAAAEATVANLLQVFFDWQARGEAHPGSLLVFYFCGHGVLVGGDQVLLAQDYGQNWRSPFRGAINFMRMYQGLASAVAGHKCFFIDACSNVPVDDLDIRDAGAEGFLPTTSPNTNWQRLMVLRAAVDGSSAYGKLNKVSRFTNALVECLRGRGAKKIGGRWVITTQSITDPLYRVLSAINFDEGGLAQVHTPEANAGEMVLQECPAPPEVPVVIDFDPQNAIDEASLTLESLQGPPRQLNRPPQTGKWAPAGVTAGFYRVKAQFRNQAFPDFESEPFAVLPPGPEPTEPIRLS